MRSPRSPRLVLIGVTLLGVGIVGAYFGFRGRPVTPQPPVVERVDEHADWLARMQAPHVAARREAIEDLTNNPRPNDVVIPALRKALTDENYSVRQASAGAIGKIGPDAEVAIPDLLAALHDEHQYVRWWSVEALGNIGRQADRVVPVLIEEARKNDPKDGQLELRQRAVTALGKFGPLAKDAVPVLKECLSGKLNYDWGVDIRAIESLGKIGEPAVPVLLEAVGDSRLGGYALNALQQIGPGAKAALPRMIEIVEAKDESWDRRKAALSIINRMGTDPAQDALIRFLGSENGDVRGESFKHLAETGSKLTPKLLPLLNDANVERRLAALRLLAEFGPEARAASPEIRKQLTDKDHKIVRYACEALIDVGDWDVEVYLQLPPGTPETPSSLDADRIQALIVGQPAKSSPILLTMLSSPDPYTVRIAIRLLSRMSLDAKQAERAISQALRSKDGRVRQDAAYTLTRLGEPGLRALIHAAQEDTDENVRWEAVGRIGQITPQTPDTIAALKRASEDGSPNVSRSAIRGLANSVDTAGEALVDALRDENESVQNAAQDVLQHSEKSTPALITALSDPDPAFRRKIIGIIIARGAKSKDAAPALERLLKDDDAGVRRDAARALVSIGGDKKTAIPALEKLLKDPDAGARCDAAQALVSIGGDKNVAIPVLVEAMKESDWKKASVDWLSPANALGACGELAVPAILYCLKSNEPNLRWGAARAITHLSKDVIVQCKTAIPILEAGLKDEATRSVSLNALVRFGPDARKVVPDLVARFPKGSSQDTAGVFNALMWLGPDAVDAVPALCDVIKNRSNYHENRSLAAQTIEAIGPGAKAAIPALIEVLGEDRPHVWPAPFTSALAGIKEPAIPALKAIALESKKSRQLRENALRALCWMGEPALPAIREILLNDKGELGDSAYQALIGLGGKVVPLFREAFKMGDPKMRKSVVFWSGQLKDGAGVELLPELTQFLEDSSFRFAAQCALRDLGPKARTAAPALGKLMFTGQERDTWAIHSTLEAIGTPVPELVQCIKSRVAHYSAMSVLKKLGPACKPVVPDLVALLKDESVDVRLNAAEVLAELGEEQDLVFELLCKERRNGTKNTLYPLSKLGPRAVPVIVEALADPSPETRVHAATLLRELKPVATEAIPALQAARKDRVRKVREAVRITLDTIRPGSAWEPLESK